jgi:hypothetical protein
MFLGTRIDLARASFQQISLGLWITQLEWLISGMKRKRKGKKE